VSTVGNVERGNAGL